MKMLGTLRKCYSVYPCFVYLLKLINISEIDFAKITKCYLLTMQFSSFNLEKYDKF